MKNAKIILAGVLIVAVACEKAPQGQEEPLILSAPQNVVLHSTGTDSFTFQWKAVENATGYDWQLLEGGAKVLDGAVTGKRNVQVGPVSKNVIYTFKVRAKAEGYGSSEWSKAVEAVINSEETPDNPEDPDTPSVQFDYEDFLIPNCEEDGVARAFPGAEGGGMYVSGGRGGKVLHVTNLNDSGEGSLRWACTQDYARTIVFDVAGVIELQSQLQVNKPNCTIAGQTAPGEGICLKNYTFRVSASNVIVRFIRCRMGDEYKTEDDAMQVMSHDNDKYTGIIIDHCSVSWSTDECASFYGMKDFTFSWNIVSESLRVSIHDKGTHGYGGIWGGNNATYHHNLLAHHDSRNPRIDHDYVSTQKGPVTIANNVVYNWRGDTCYGGESSANNGSDFKKYNYFNNYYKPGPATPSNHIWLLHPTTSCSNCGGTIIPGHFYMDGNIMYGQSAISSNNWTANTSSPVGVYINAADASKIKVNEPFATGTSLSIHSGENCLEPVLNFAGASLARDAIDERIANETRNGTATYKGSKSGIAGLIDTQTDVQEDWWKNSYPAYSATADQLNGAKDADGDGIPNAWEDFFGLDKSKNSDGAAKTLDPNGRYTNLEMYLHWLVKDIVAAQNADGKYTSF